MSEFPLPLYLLIASKALLYSSSTTLPDLIDSVLAVISSKFFLSVSFYNMFVVEPSLRKCVITCDDAVPSLICFSAKSMANDTIWFSLDSGVNPGLDFPITLVTFLATSMLLSLTLVLVFISEMSFKRVRWVYNIGESKEDND